MQKFTEDQIYLSMKYFKNSTIAFICNYLFLYLTMLFLCFRRNRELVESLSKPSINSKELTFPTKYSQSSFEQFLTCLWKQNLSYWRNPQYTAVRFLYTVTISLMLGTICWKFGANRFLLVSKPSVFFL